MVLETTETVPHAPPTPPQRDIVRTDIHTRPNAIQNTRHSTAVPATLLCRADGRVPCGVLRIPHTHMCAHKATCYQPQTYIAYAHKSGHKAETAPPSPPRAAVAILIIPPHARSYTIVDGIIVGIIIVIILSHASSSSCLPCNPRLPICPNFPTRSPPPPVPCK